MGGGLKIRRGPLRAWVQSPWDFAATQQSSGPAEARVWSYFHLLADSSIGELGAIWVWFLALISLDSFSYGQRSSENEWIYGGLGSMARLWTAMQRNLVV